MESSDLAHNVGRVTDFEVSYVQQVLGFILELFHAQLHHQDDVVSKLSD